MSGHIGDDAAGYNAGSAYSINLVDIMAYSNVPNVPLNDFDSDILWRDSSGSVFVWDDGKLGTGWSDSIGYASFDYTCLNNIV